jgi:CheY-like chemotaxis protein
MAKLLVVDDDEGTLAWMAAALEGAGHDVRTARRSRCALEMVRTWAPDLILTDILMPEIDGFAFSRLALVSRRVPVMLVSALKKEAEAILRGVAGYVQKPFTAPELLAAVERVLGKGASDVSILVVDDDPEILTLYRTILEPRFGVLLAMNGREALDVLKTESAALAVVDVHMPVMNGIQLIRALRDDPQLHTLPVIVQTSDQTAVRAPVWADLHVAQVLSKQQFVAWLLAQIDEHIAAAA